MHTGLFFGSFNPIHVGHLMLANFIIEYTDLDQLWFVVSPHNPFKQRKTLLNDYHRLEMVKLSIEDDNRFQASNIEFNMPKPSYTIDTLVYLSEKYPERKFSIIMGSDGLPTFHKWKNQEQIVERYHRYVYPRPGSEKLDFSLFPNLSIVNAPLLEISSSFIRKAIKDGKDVRYFLPSAVYKFVDEMNFYKK